MCIHSFDWIFKSRTPLELGRRVDTLIRLVEQEGRKAAEEKGDSGVPPSALGEHNAAGENYAAAKKERWSSEQVEAMEVEFEKDAKPSKQKVEELAKQMDTSEARVKTWFANRATKKRKQEAEALENAKKSKA